MGKMFARHGLCVYLSTDTMCSLLFGWGVFCQVPIDADLLADGDGLSAAEQVTYGTENI